MTKACSNLFFFQVKDNWDDESTGEDEPETPVQLEPVKEESKPVKPVQQKSVESGSEEEEEEESSSESEEESSGEEDLSAYDKAARRIEVSPGISFEVTPTSSIFLLKV